VLTYVMVVSRNDLRDWQEATRLKAVQLLYMLVWQSEDDVTMHAEKVFDSLAAALADDAAAVADLGRRTADLLGYMLRPTTWAPLLLNRLQECGSGGSVRTNLVLIAGMVGGAERLALRPCLEDVAFCLAADGVCRDLSEAHQMALLQCTGRLLEVSRQDCAGVTEHLFQAIIPVLAAAATEAIREAARDQLRSLADLCCETTGDDTSNDLVTTHQILYRRHMGRILKGVAATAAGWSAYAYDRLIFEALLVESGPAVGHFTASVLDIFKAALGAYCTAEPEARLRLFILLAKLLLNLGATLDSQGQFAASLPGLIDDVIYPALRWQGGRTAMAIRAAATSALLSVVAAVSMDLPALAIIAAKVNSRLVGLFRDDCAKTRKMALQAMRRILQSLTNTNDDNPAIEEAQLTICLAEAKMLTSLATGLKERLEDETEAVMIEAINCSIKYLNFLPHKIATDDTKVTKSVDALLTSLVLHMDNENVEIRLLLLNSLQEKLQQGWIKIRLLEHATKAQEVHRHREEIQKLVSSLSMALEPPIEE
jgi:hypothetical protein